MKKALKKLRELAITLAGVTAFLLASGYTQYQDEMDKQQDLAALSSSFTSVE